MASRKPSRSLQVFANAVNNHPEYGGRSSGKEHSLGEVNLAVKDAQFFYFDNNNEYQQEYSKLLPNQQHTIVAKYLYDRRSNANNNSPTTAVSAATAVTEYDTKHTNTKLCQHMHQQKTASSDVSLQTNNDGGTIIKTNVDTNEPSPQSIRIQYPPLSTSSKTIPTNNTKTDTLSTVGGFTNNEIQLEYFANKNDTSSSNDSSKSSSSSGLWNGSGAAKYKSAAVSGSSKNESRKQNGRGSDIGGGERSSDRTIVCEDRELCEKKKSTATASDIGGGERITRLRATISNTPQCEQVSTTSISLNYPPSQYSNTLSNKKKASKKDVKKKSKSTVAVVPSGRRKRLQRGSATNTTSYTITKQYTTKGSGGKTTFPLTLQSPNKDKGIRGIDKPRRIVEGAVDKKKVLFSSPARASTIDNDNGILGSGRRKRVVRDFKEEEDDESVTSVDSASSGYGMKPSASVLAGTKSDSECAKKKKNRKRQKIDNVQTPPTECGMKHPPQQDVPPPQLPIGRQPSRPVVPIPQIDDKLDKALRTYTQSIHQTIERGEVYNYLPSNQLLEKELQTPATLKEIKSISSDNHFGTATSMVVERLGTKSPRLFKQDNHAHKTVEGMIQKVAAIRRLRPLIGSKMTQEEHAKMCLGVSYSYRYNFKAGLPPEARAVLNMGAPANHLNSRFHNQNYATTKELKLLTEFERIHNNGCRRQSCCPLVMNCLIPMYMKELAGDKCLSKFQLSLDDICQGDNWWFALDNDDGSQAAFKRIIARQALAFCGCSYHEVFVVSLLDLAVKHELCLTVYGTPGMTLISSVYATDLKLFDTRMKEMNLYSAVCTLLMLYPHMENLITERVIVMYNEEHLVKLDECLLYFLGPLLGIDEVFPVISQWRAENMPPGARAELRKIKLALLAKARAVLKETRRAYKAGEELTPKQQTTIAKLDKMYQDARDLWKRYKNGEVLLIDEEVRINAQQKGNTVTMPEAREAVKDSTASDEQQDMVDRQDEGLENGRENISDLHKLRKAFTSASKSILGEEADVAAIFKVGMYDKIENRLTKDEKELYGWALQRYVTENGVMEKLKQYANMNKGDSNPMKNPAHVRKLHDIKFRTAIKKIIKGCTKKKDKIEKIMSECAVFKCLASEYPETANAACKDVEQVGVIGSKKTCGVENCTHCHKRNNSTGQQTDSGVTLPKQKGSNRWATGIGTNGKDSFPNNPHRKCWRFERKLKREEAIKLLNKAESFL